MRKYLVGIGMILCLIAFFAIRVKTRMAGKADAKPTTKIAANVALANEQIEVAIAAHRGIAIGLHRKHRPFDDQGPDSLQSKTIQDTK